VIDHAEKEDAPVLPGKGHQERSNVIGMHGQFWEDQEIDCLAVTTGHAAMRVP
jgi:hypothetical protein